MTKTLLKFFVAVYLVVALVSLAPPVQAQTNSATGSASAQITNPLEFGNKTPLDFGDFISPAAQGTITVAPDIVTLTTTVGVVLIDSLSAGRGTFIVLGDPNRAYDVSGDISVDLTTGAPTSPGPTLMTAQLAYRADSDGIVGNPTTGTLGADGVGGAPPGSGIDVIGVGGTLTVNANQASGVYDGTYNITANYQ